jgi:hypothetical protein
MKAALLEGERERERAYEYVVSRFPQTDTLVPGFALHENTCLWRERESCNRAATELQNLLAQVFQFSRRFTGPST